METMRKDLFFILIIGAFTYSCTNSPQPENTKPESGGVNTSTSQSSTLPSQLSDKAPTQSPGKSDIPRDPEPVAITSNTPQPATTPQPSPERTNVPPAKEVAQKPVAPPTSSTSENKPNPPANTDSSTKPSLGKIPAADLKDSTKKTDKDTPKPTSLSHQAWDGLLKKYVSASGKVDYAGFKTDVSKFDAYLQSLQSNPPQPDWARNEKMAYWINAYNAFTIKLIVDNYPVSSITKLNGGKPWDKKWIKIGGKTYSLNNIENDILRPKYKDARIHFAVNCAAKSCPPLLNRAWTADNLISNFEKQAKAFINNPSFNVITANKVQVSKIFDWYGADFGNLIAFLNKYSTTKISSGAKVEFKEYDWELNN